MPQGRFKSNTFKKIVKKAPGGKQSVRYEKRNPSRAKCADCGDALKGVPRGRPIDIKRFSKTQKRPQRPFGGVLCSKCSRKKYVDALRVS